MDDIPTLRALHGSQFDPDSKGYGSVLVLGNHNTGTSMLMRGLMMLGLYAGPKQGVSQTLKWCPWLRHRSLCSTRSA